MPSRKDLEMFKWLATGCVFGIGALLTILFVFFFVFWIALG